MCVLLTDRNINRFLNCLKMDYALLLRSKPISCSNISRNWTPIALDTAHKLFTMIWLNHITDRNSLSVSEKQSCRDVLSAARRVWLGRQRMQPLSFFLSHCLSAWWWMLIYSQKITSAEWLSWKNILIFSIVWTFCLALCHLNSNVIIWALNQSYAFSLVPSTDRVSQQRF